VRYQPELLAAGPGVLRVLDLPLLALIHPSAWKVNSPKFGPHRTTELAVDLYFRLAVDRGVKRDHHPDRGACVRPYFGTIKLEY